jgi:TRAP-type C4-dicarboxylate transport system permease small subunit
MSFDIEKAQKSRDRQCRVLVLFTWVCLVAVGNLNVALAWQWLTTSSQAYHGIERIGMTAFVLIGYCGLMAIQLLFGIKAIEGFRYWYKARRNEEGELLFDQHFIDSRRLTASLAMAVGSMVAIALLIGAWHLAQHFLDGSNQGVGYAASVLMLWVIFSYFYHTALYRHVERWRRRPWTQPWTDQDLEV